MFCDANDSCVAFAYADSNRECVLLGRGATGGLVSLVSGSAAGGFAAVRIMPTGPSTVYVMPMPSPTSSGMPSSGSGSGTPGLVTSPIGTFTGVTTSGSLSAGCERRTTVIAVTA